MGDDKLRPGHFTSNGEPWKDVTESLIDKVRDLEARLDSRDRLVNDTAAAEIRELKALAKRYEEALREIVENEKCGSIESITSLIAREALATGEKEEK